MALQSEGPKSEATLGATVREVAALARLELAPDEAARLGGELAQILEAFRALGRADVTGVAPLVAPLPGGSGLRPDVPVPGLAREELLARAPDACAGPGAGQPAFFRVPRAIDEERTG